MRPDAAQRGFAGVSAEEVCEERGGVAAQPPARTCRERRRGLARGLPPLAFGDFPPTEGLQGSGG